jgi:hypothetical protein
MKRQLIATERSRVEPGQPADRLDLRLCGFEAL